METIMKKQLFFLSLFALALLLIAGNSQAWEGAPARAETNASTITLYATSDAWVDAAAPDTNYGTYDQLSAGQINHRYRNILLRFDLSSVPAGSHISAAYLEMQTIINLQALTGAGAEDNVLELHAARLDDRWSESRVTWNNQPNATELGDPPTDVHTGDLWKRIDVTRIMRSLITKGDRNYGILVAGDGATEGAMSFYAREHSQETRPRLRIEYTIPTATATNTPRATRTPTVTPRFTPTPTHTPRPTITPTPTTTPASGVPLDARRRAAQHLEEVRNTDAAPTWRHATLGETIRPLYRPDIHAPAYYEFPVVDAGDQSPLGFIIVSTGKHDYPIPHWAYDGIPITQQLEQLAADKGEHAVKFYKLDALAYAAENSDGERVATRSDQPLKITGLDPAWIDNPSAVIESDWIPNLALLDDADANQITGTYTVTGPTPPPNLHFSAWESWGALKAGYTASYGVLLDALRRDASASWAAEAADRDHGHLLHKGETVTLPLLFSGPNVTFSGQGAHDIRFRVIPRSGLPSLLEVTAARSIQGEVIPLAAVVAYANGVSETIHFLIVDPYRTFMPLVGQGAMPLAGVPQSNEQTMGAQGVVRIQEADSYWHNYYAGTSADQTWYMQIPRGESPNTSDCPSGCGATAWSMLFGWIDNQAPADSGNDYWQGRWGLFRAQTGNDATAPKIWTNSDWRFSALKDMTWEIRNDIDTWCYDEESAPTKPWNMIDVGSYLNGRSAIRLSTKYGYASSIRVYAQNGIAYSGEGKHTPVIMGMGLLDAHYPLAYGYRWHDHNSFWGTTTTREFLVNEGWAQGHGEWIRTTFWFAGRAFPYAAWNDDVGLYNPAAGQWYLDYDHTGHTSEGGFSWGMKNKLPVVGDFNRNNILGDIAIYDPDNANWYFDFNHDQESDEFTHWGYSGGKPFVLDHDCDGFVDDLGFYIESAPVAKWKFANDLGKGGESAGGNWGQGWEGALPIAGDFDRDGCVDDLGLFLPSTRMWKYQYNNTPNITHVSVGPWGQPGDIPIAGDFDRDGFIDDVAVFRPSTGKWFYDYDHDGYSDDVKGPWGGLGLLPIAGNFETK